MASILLTVLKIIGIILLCILLLLLTVLLLVLFVPVRYQIKGFRKEKDEVPIRVALKVTWLLHILNISFRYPEEMFVKIRIFCFTVFSTRENPDNKKNKEKARAENAKETGGETVEKEQGDEEKKEPEKEGERENTECTKFLAQNEENNSESEEEEIPTLSKFLQKLFFILKNIKYTICQIYDKIKYIIKNVRYYIKILKSDTFKRAWSLCSSEVIKLVKSILPGKLMADFVIGLNDPASTAQVLSIQGILYPLIGDHIRITPDFENSIIEGNFFIKGKITVFRIIVTAAKIYFNRNFRRIIRLFKKEAA